MFNIDQSSEEMESVRSSSAEKFPFEDEVHSKIFFLSIDERIHSFFDFSSLNHRFVFLVVVVIVDFFFCITFDRFRVTKEISSGEGKNCIREKLTNVIVI